MLRKGECNCVPSNHEGNKGAGPLGWRPMTLNRFNRLALIK